LPPEEGHSAPSSSDEDDPDDGEVYYRDYRTRQRASLLVAHAYARVGVVRQEMERFLKYMRDLGCGSLKRDELDAFSFDLHDLSLDNIFVDELDHTTIVSWNSLNYFALTGLTICLVVGTDLNNRLGIDLYPTIMAMRAPTCVPRRSPALT